MANAVPKAATTLARALNRLDGNNPRVTISFDPSEGRTKQSHKDECDINALLKRWESTGQINHLNTFSAQYGDFSNVDDYQAAQNQVLAAQGAFDALPSRVRSRFANDPVKLIEFMQDENNEEEAINLGLINPKEPDQVPAPEGASTTKVVSDDPKD